MATNAISAVLFVKSLSRVASFYREVLGAKTLDRSDQHESLECRGFHLVVHQIPPGLAESVEITTPPERREQTAVRLNFPVASIENARESARRLGGQVDDSPPPWAGDSARMFLGFDPEGNVIGLMPAARSMVVAAARSRWLAILGVLLACSCWITAPALYGNIVGESFSENPAEQAQIYASKQFWTVVLLLSWLGGMVASSAIAGFTLRSNRVLATLTLLILAAFALFVVWWGSG